MAVEPQLDLPARIRAIRRIVRTEYRKPDGRPWIVGFSGGKDSSLVLQLVVEAVLQCAPEERTRRVYVVSNDTLVESPVVAAYVDVTLERVQQGVDALGLPLSVHQTAPAADNTFWVNLLGRGYPAPNRNFRWCTDRMKIRPTTVFIRERAQEHGEVVLLLGVRKSESAARAMVVNRYSNGEGHYNPHNDVKNCVVFRPIVDLSTDDVWMALLSCQPPWGGSHRDLVTLYRNANGGECPFVTSDDDAPSCGSASPRFGCWTCTVVEKDRSLAALIDAGHEHLEPLFAFRNRIKEISGTPSCRSKTRRNGRHGLGPLTMDTRRMLLSELLIVQRETELPLITDDEVRRIRNWWQRDQMTHAIREARALEDQVVRAAE